MRISFFDAPGCGEGSYPIREVKRVPFQELKPRSAEIYPKWVILFRIPDITLQKQSQVSFTTYLKIRNFLEERWNLEVIPWFCSKHGYTEPAIYLGP